MTHTDPDADPNDGQAEHRAEPRTEQDILRRAQQGESDACRQLVHQYYGMVYRLAYNFLSHAEDARDIAQEAFLRAFRSMDRFDLRYRFGPWIKKITMNLVIDAIRSRYRSKTVAVEDIDAVSGNAADPADGPIAEEESRRVRQIIRELPPKYRTVMVLRDMEGHTVAEIADMVDAPPATVRWRLHQARKLFRHKWERTESS